MLTLLGRSFGNIGEWATVGMLSYNIFELSFLNSTVSAYHLVMLSHRKGRILLVSIGRLCTFFAPVCAVFVSPAVLWNGWS